MLREGIDAVRQRFLAFRGEERASVAVALEASAGAHILQHAGPLSEMDAELQALIWTLSVDFAFLFICLIIFQCMEKKHPRYRYHSHTHQHIQGQEDEHSLRRDHETAALLGSKKDTDASAASLPAAPFFDCFFGRLRLRNTQGNLYLRYLQWSLVLSLALTLFAVPVLVALYVGNHNPDGDPTLLQQASAGNIALGSVQLACPFVAVLLVSALIYVQFARYIRDIRLAQAQLDANHRSDAQEQLARHTLHLEGVSARLTNERFLHEFLDAQFPGRVQQVVIVHDLSPVVLLVRKRRDVELEMARTRVLEEREGRPLRRNACGCVSRSPSASTSRPLVMPGLESQRQAIDAALADARQQPLRGTGHAFVVFRGAPPLVQMAALRADKYWVQRHVDPADWSVSLAPPPADIVWDSLSISPAQHWTRIIFLNLALFILMVLSSLCSIFSFLGFLFFFFFLPLFFFFYSFFLPSFLRPFFLLPSLFFPQAHRPFHF